MNGILKETKMFLSQISNSLNKIPKDKEIITICLHGNRSGMATFMLLEKVTI
jgi:rhodanese-related sulfurtransferase